MNCGLHFLFRLFIVRFFSEFVEEFSQRFLLLLFHVMEFFQLRHFIMFNCANALALCHWFEFDVQK